MRSVRADLKVALGGAAAAVVLAAASTAAIAAATGGGGAAANEPGGWMGGPREVGTSCSVPSPTTGSIVRVALIDMGGGMMGGAMSVAVTPATVPAGTTTLEVANDGWRTHELVVLPLAGDARPGQRLIGPDGTVSEDGSLGEASATCAAGEGDGISAGSSGWVKLDLAPGRYELVCNLPDHYSAGMYAELDVTG